MKLIDAIIVAFAWVNWTLFLASGGFILSILNVVFNWQNRRAAQRQEQRREPRVVAALTNGFYMRDTVDGGRRYALQVTLTNPSDTNNSIAAADLRVSYLTVERIEMTVKLKANDPTVGSFVRGSEGANLGVPFKVPSHEAVSGWLTFRLPEQVVRGAEIESYVLVLTDAHQAVMEVEPSPMQEYRDETAV